jgi:hypothetical protein
MPNVITLESNFESETSNSSIMPAPQLGIGIGTSHQINYQSVSQLGQVKVGGGKLPIYQKAGSGKGGGARGPGINSDRLASRESNSSRPSSST